MKPIVRTVALPDVLFTLDPPLTAKELFVAGDITRTPEERVVAIVGSREAAPESLKFAGRLARAVVEAGGIVASGGAFGIDAAAHRGALDAGGRTWVHMGGGFDRPYPIEHKELFDTIASNGGALLSMFPPRARPFRHQFHCRNRILIAMADAIVVVQAAKEGGARNAARETRRQKRALFVVPVAPWASEGFEGSLLELERGAQALTTIDAFLRTLGLAPGSKRPHLARPNAGQSLQKAAGQLARTLSPSESAVAQTLSDTPQHLDFLVARAGLPTAEVATALLTLALENVVVEGPAGFYRWAIRT
jgi:DNA processing protein